MKRSGKSSLKDVHLDCLLKWLKEKQAGLLNNNYCPACKFQYKIKLQFDPIRFVVKGVNRLIDFVVPFYTVGVCCVGVYIMSFSYGGTNYYTTNFLKSIVYAVLQTCSEELSSSILNFQQPNFKQFIGLPMIPLVTLALIFNRTNYGDTILPCMSFLIFGNQTLSLTQNSGIISMNALTLTPQLMVCFFPWVRIIYQRCLKRLKKLILGVDIGVDEYGVENVDNIVEIGDSNGRRKGERLVIGSLLFPGVSSIAGSILSQFSVFRNYLPEVFLR
ncbi:hypothetical protein HK099_003582 [Clydaea vesicula]|uniref:Uncharacterized protein n=1 Tax=Clydaea vesicula TaxID=447962 RepID=A0AAD5Y068_9FUNG|nr:hypothetical protein HK099_003582 [Clydaea vesicula]